METGKKVSRTNLGKIGERAASAYLTSKGFKIICVNYRFAKMGEIDIIASENEYICFVEVKTRTCKSFGEPREAVSRKKQETIRKLAWTYIKSNNLAGRNIRFDVVEVTGRKSEGTLADIKINLIRNAF